MTKIKNLEKLAKRIFRAVKNNERVVLYGDADLDGTVAIMILKEIIVNLGGQEPVVYFSDRKTEEPGLNETGLNILKSKAPALLIVADCGISNFKEAQLAQKLGILNFQQRFLGAGECSYISKRGMTGYYGVMLQTNDVVTINEPSYGGTYEALIKTMTIRRDGAPEFQNMILQAT